MENIKNKLKNRSIPEIAKLTVEVLRSKIEKTSLKHTKLKGLGITKEMRSCPIIISLTSFPARINYVDKCIKTLLNQTMKPDRVILWLAKEQFKNLEDDLPGQLLLLRDFGLEIRWYHDIRSYKKLIPTLREFPNSIIITADDDNYYSRNWLDLLYKGYLKYPEYIQCHRITKFFFMENGELSWISGGRDFYKMPSYLNKLVGAGGVLYPPNCLYKDVLNEEIFMRLAPTNDDQWFWFMAILNDRKINVVENNIFRIYGIKGTETSSLTNINDYGERLFVTQLNALLNYYPRVKNSLFCEYCKLPLI